MNLNNKTTIPLFAALTTLPLVVGALLWLTSIDSKATKGAEMADVIQEVRERVIRIEALLEADRKRE